MNLLMLPLFAQAAQGIEQTLQTGDAALTPVENVAQINMLQMAFKGGWIMIVLLALLIVCAYIFFERLYVLKNARKEDPEFMDKVVDYIKSNEVKSAVTYCQMTNTPAARMIRSGISRLGRSVQDTQQAIENVGNVEVAQLERGLSFVATIAGVAPMIGFLGTVIGMVQAFYEMANAGSNINITLLSGGIYQAMITTVGGLVVGILALFAYNLLVSRVDRVVNAMEAKTMIFMDMLNDISKGGN